MDGFSWFSGVASAVGLAFVVALSVGWAGAAVKEDAIKLGYFQYYGKYYSVKPATVLRVE